MSKTEALPPLPEPRVFTAASDRLLFTADQMRDYARAALAQRQQVPEGARYFKPITSCADCPACVYGSAGFYECEKAERRKFEREGKPRPMPSWCPLPALTAAPSAQAEPDDEPRFTAGGGFPGDHNGEKAAQAEPQEPLTDEIAEAFFDAFQNDRRILGDFEAFVGTLRDAIERAHGIGKQEGT